MKGILFSGVHGVGKGFFLEKVKEHIKRYNVYSASSLIERYKPSTDAGYKKVNDVGNNQAALLTAIQEILKIDKKDFILDGHLCLFNAKGEVTKIPMDFFQKAQITGIILLQDKPELICARINNRDAMELNLQDIVLMQQQEQNYAELLREKLGIPYKIITHECTEPEFLRYLTELGGNKVE